MAWQEGRQGTGYYKWPLLISKRFRFDSYILKYPVGTEIPLHNDTVPGAKHFRLNFVIKRSRTGGEFKCENTIFRLGRIVLFRPDLEPHSVTKIGGNSRYVFSLGWLWDL